MAGSQISASAAVKRLANGSRIAQNRRIENKLQSNIGGSKPGTLEWRYGNAPAAMNLIREHWHFISGLISILIVDLTLRGDNAVVIAAAARPLPKALRKRALAAGAGCAVLALVVATFFATRLLQVKFLQLLGGIAIVLVSVPPT